jgi:hypothetical protein
LKPDEILQQTLEDGVTISIYGEGKIKVAGDQEAVETWLPMITSNKAELLAALSPTTKNSPAICQNCNKLGVLIIAGTQVAGCVNKLDHEPWCEEWHRLPADLQKCIFDMITCS